MGAACALDVGAAAQRVATQRWSTWALTRVPVCASGSQVRTYSEVTLAGDTVTRRWPELPRKVPARYR